MLIVLDTNVLVSSMLKHNSKPALIMNAILEGKIQIAIDKRIFNEYTDVLHRPKLNIPADKADAILRFIAFSALWVQSQPVEFQRELVNDPGDIPFAEVAICSHSDVLVTGNMKHFGFLRNTNTKVLLPDEFLAQYSHIL
jgi:uncharacterized protein